MEIYTVKQGKYIGYFFDEDNMNLAIADHDNPEYRVCNSIVEAINYTNIIHGKIYAVASGRICGIFTNWPDCQAQTNGYQSAVFHSFYDFDEAINFITSYTKKHSHILIPDTTVPKTGCVAYVDGSYNVKNSEYGWGAVMYFDGVQYTTSGSGKDEENVKLRNVAGEILGVQRAINIAIEKGYDEIDIYYDYYGIEKWATGEWKRNKPQTIAYYNFIQSVKDFIKINFHKVKSHTGVELNELVDRLAKNACGIE